MRRCGVRGCGDEIGGENANVATVQLITCIGQCKVSTSEMSNFLALAWD